MSEKLLIVESPAKAKTISKYLDDSFTVTASVGHIRDLPKSNKKALDIEGGFIPHYEISKGKDKVVSEIKKLAENSDEIIIATDPDREGEAIAWHISEILKDQKNKIKRAVYHEITEEAVKDALKNTRKIDQNLRKAQEARRVLDRLVGYDLSGLIWKKVRYGLSAGRVQSPALRILMEREREIREFKSTPFWIITALTKTKQSKELKVECKEAPITEEESKRIIDTAHSGKWTVSDIKETKAKRSPSAPFITSTLQQSASTRFGFSPSRTMAIAQKLYEAGHITYMRTDSTNLSKQAIGQIIELIKKEYGENCIQARIFKTKSKNAQEAHEAIRPSHINKKIAGNTADEKKLYNLIWQRTVASQMKDAELLRTKVSVKVDDSIPEFFANGSRLIKIGWLEVDPAARGDDVELPEVKVGENLDLISIDGEKKMTEPPGRYSEAGLIKELEKRGIGRPSTYASIIKTLDDRGYVTRDQRRLTPTDTGDVVSTFLESNFARYISDDFTAEMENELDEIAEGKRDYTKTLSDFYKPFTKDVKSKEDIEKLTTLGDADKKFKCPKCGAKMNIKLGKNGKFLSCSRYPECDGALTIEGVEIKPDEPIGTHPESGENVYVKVGKYGPYVQLGERVKGKTKPKMAKIPDGTNLENISINDATKWLSLPRELGTHPKTGKTISASAGRFGPYIVHDGDFRSLKKDDVYTISLPRALEILAEEKKTRKRAKKK